MGSIGVPFFEARGRDTRLRIDEASFDPDILNEAT